MIWFPASAGKTDSEGGLYDAVVPETPMPLPVAPRSIRMVVQPYFRPNDVIARQTRAEVNLGPGSERLSGDMPLRVASLGSSQRPHGGSASESRWGY